MVHSKCRLTSPFMEFHGVRVKRSSNKKNVNTESCFAVPSFFLPLRFFFCVSFIFLFPPLCLPVLFSPVCSFWIVPSLFLFLSLTPFCFSPQIFPGNIAVFGKVLHKIQKYFTSSDPHRDTIFWHSFWHNIWKYMWRIYIWLYIYIYDYIYIYMCIYCDILSDILSGRYSDILSGIHSDILSGIHCGIPSGIHPDILSRICADILSGIPSHIFWQSFWHIYWHIYWHSTWHIFRPFILAVYLASILTSYPTDLAKVRCYKCGGVGHIKVAPTSDGKPTYQGKGSKGISPGKGPSNSNQKPKGFFFPSNAS